MNSTIPARFASENSSGRILISASALAFACFGLLAGSFPNSPSVSAEPVAAGSPAVNFTDEELLDMLFISDFETNEPPRITTVPRRFASPLQAYEYPVTALDPENDPLLFALLEAPAGMEIDLFTGRVSWPGPVLGDHTIELLVQDIFGGLDTQAWVLTVNENSPPQILSSPLVDAVAGTGWIYQPEVIDADLDPLEFTLVQGPEGMTIDPVTGRLGWLPQSAGEFSIGWRVEDPIGKFDTQDFILSVSSLPQSAPEIVSSPPADASIEAEYVYAVAAEDPDGDLAGFRLIEAPLGMRIDPENGRITWTPAFPGEAQIVVEAFDAGARSDRQPFTINVATSPGLEPPEWQDDGTLIAPLGRTSKFQLSATDPDGDALRYFIEPLPLPPGMRFDSLNGAFEFTPSLDQVGQHRLIVTATDGRFRADREVTIEVPPAGSSTQLRGRVQFGLDEPLPGVRLAIGQQQVFSGPDGYFEFENLTLSGEVGMIVDGATVDSPATFATVPKAVSLIPGARNLLQDPIILLPLDTASADPVDPAQTSRITSAPVVKDGETFAPVTLTIPPNTARWEATGELYDGEIHITNIPDNSLSPQPLPDELGFSVYVAMQPFGVVYDEPVPISFPNVDGLLPGSSMDIFGLDHNTGQFVKFGKAEVSADGATVDSIGGVVVANSWHGMPPPPPDPESDGEDDDSDDEEEEDCECGSRVGLSEGNLTIRHALPAYQSLGASRNVTFRYNHITAEAKPIINIRQRIPLLLRARDNLKISAKLNIGGLGLTSEQFWSSGEVLAQAGLQFPARTLLTGVYDYGLEARLSTRFGSRMVPVDGKLGIVNSAESPFGSGWQIDGLERIYPSASGDVLVSEGRPGGTIFRHTVDGFSAPPGEFSSLIQTPDGFERRYPDGTVKRFNPEGLLITESDRNGNTTTYQYDLAGRLLTIIDPIGLETTFGYSAGNLATVTDPAGRITRFEHDAFGRLVRIIEPDGGARTFQYAGSSGRIIAKTNQRGLLTEYRYDPFGRLASALRADGSEVSSVPTAIQGLIDPESDLGSSDQPASPVPLEDVAAEINDGNGNITRFEVDARGKITNRTDALGRTTTTERDADSNPIKTIRADDSVVTRTFDDHGNVLSEIETANDATTTWTYDPFDQVTSITDPRGHTTTFERDANGNLTRITNPLGHETIMEYNQQGQMTRRVDANGLETVLEYNAQGLVSKRTETPADTPENARVTTFEYTATGDPARITTPSGTVQQFTYDAEGRPTEITDNLGQRMVMEYDTKGNLVRTETRNADGTVVNLQQQAYDELNRLLEARSPHTAEQDSITQFAYDGEGNQTGIIDPNGHITVREYDAIDRLVKEVDPAGGSTAFGYDARNQLIRVVAPNNATTTFEFDPLSRQTAEHSPDRGTIQQEYDLADNVTASTDARGIRREMTYDALNRLQTTNFPELDEDVTYTYDKCKNGLGRVCTIDDESGTLEYEYDGFGNITRTTKTELGIEYITEYAYDLEDRITAIVYPSGRRVEYQRDILGRVTEVRAELAGQMQPILTNIQYRADGRITAATFGNGLEESRTYDLQGRLVHQDLTDQTGLVIDERTYTYDPAGNITSRTGTPGDQQYDYDALDRLIGQDLSTDGKSWQYGYGPNHNRQSRTDGALLNESYDYQPDSNRLIGIVKLTGQADSTPPASRQFIYNQANRFSEYIEDGQTIAEYTYNALGQRTRKKLQSETRLFHYDTGIQLLAETDDAGNPQKDYLWLGRRPIAQIESTGLITYLHTDHLLTPRIGTSDAQSIVWQWEAEAFGDTEASGLMEVNLRFPGQYFDRETSDHYNYFRNYSPGLGRYIQSDPIGLRGGANLFIYSDGSPLVLIDPKGLDPFGTDGPVDCIGFSCICLFIDCDAPPPTVSDIIQPSCCINPRDFEPMPPGPALSRFATTRLGSPDWRSWSASTSRKGGSTDRHVE